MQQQSELCMIVPRVPPAVDGIGDYSFLLARQLYENYGWRSHFLIGDPDWRGASEGAFFRISSVAARSQNALQSLLPEPSAKLLLHYAGHGYAKRGCPVWLVDALDRWCQSGGSLVTMFHELYATGPLFSSAILTSPLQKHLATRLMRISDRCFTSQKQYAEKIYRLSRRTHLHIPTYPIFSTIGEASHPQPLSQRSRHLIVFGGTGPRSRVYQRSHQALAQICQALAIEEILDIGPTLNFEPEPIPGTAIVSLGVQSASEISRYLEGAIAGFLDYPTAFLGKSTIFAAYCAHRTIPIVVSSLQTNNDGLQANDHYWLVNQSAQALNLEQGQAIADAAHRWYQTHNLETQAREFARSLKLVGNEEIVTR